MVDTGTTVIVLASDAFQRYQEATGATVDNSTGLLTIENIDNLESMFFNIGNVSTKSSIIFRISYQRSEYLRIHCQCPNLAS